MTERETPHCTKGSAHWTIHLDGALPATNGGRTAGANYLVAFRGRSKPKFILILGTVEKGTAELTKIIAAARTTTSGGGTTNQDTQI